MRGISKHCPCCSGSPLAPHPDLLPSDAEREVGPHDRLSAGDDARALDFVLEIYPLFETAGKGCRNGLSFGGSLGQPACLACWQAGVGTGADPGSGTEAGTGVVVENLWGTGSGTLGKNGIAGSAWRASWRSPTTPQSRLGPLSSRLRRVSVRNGGRDRPAPGRPSWGLSVRLRGFLGAVRPERGELAAERGRSGPLMVGEPGGGAPPTLWEAVNESGGGERWRSPPLETHVSERWGKRRSGFPRLETRLPESGGTESRSPPAWKRKILVNGGN
jgi:hypothetical protein